MVEESLGPEASVAEVARRHDVHPNQLHSWRRQARLGILVAGLELGRRSEGGCRFTPMMVAPAGQVAGLTRADAGGGPVIELVLGNGRVLRLPEGVTPARAAALADALEGSGR